MTYKGCQYSPIVRLKVQLPNATGCEAQHHSNGGDESHEDSHRDGYGVAILLHRSDHKFAIGVVNRSQIV